MGSIIFEACVLLISFVTSTILFSFDRMDLLSYLITFPPHIFSLAWVIVQYILLKKRRKKIMLLRELKKLYSYILAVIDDTIRVTLGRRRSGAPPLPYTAESKVDEIFRQNEEKIKRFIKLFAKKSERDRIFKEWKVNINTMKTFLSVAEQDLKISEPEQSKIDIRKIKRNS